MSKDPGKTSVAGTKTGKVPRIDVEPEKQHEPPEPPELPEIHNDPGSITGVIRYASEGEDNAKQSDNSAQSQQ